MSLIFLGSVLLKIIFYFIIFYFILLVLYFWKSPYELWKVYAPNIAYLKVWGWLAKVLNPKPKN